MARQSQTAIRLKSDIFQNFIDSNLVLKFELMIRIVNKADLLYAWNLLKFFIFSGYLRSILKPRINIRFQLNNFSISKVLLQLCTNSDPLGSQIERSLL